MRLTEDVAASRLLGQADLVVAPGPEQLTLAALLRRASDAADEELNRAIRATYCQAIITRPLTPTDLAGDLAENWSGAMIDRVTGLDHLSNAVAIVQAAATGDENAVTIAALEAWACS